MDSKDYIGLDVGLQRTGFARASNVAKIAEPLYTIPTPEVVKKLRELVKENDLEAIVVGLPRNLSGEDTKQTQWVRQWVDKAKEEIDLPFYAQDEALTSKIAEAKNLSGKKLQDIDSLAAGIILQDFLNSSDIERKAW